MKPFSALGSGCRCVIPQEGLHRATWWKGIPALRSGLLCLLCLLALTDCLPESIDILCVRSFRKPPESSTCDHCAAEGKMRHVLSVCSMHTAPTRTSGKKRKEILFPVEFLPPLGKEEKKEEKNPTHAPEPRCAIAASFFSAAFSHSVGVLAIRHVQHRSYILDA